MKKILLHHYWLMAFVLAILPTALEAQVSYTHDFSSIQPYITDTVIDGVTYQTITVDGLDLTNEPGAPQLPCKILKFSVPYNASNISISSTCGFPSKISLHNGTILSAPYPRAMCDTTPEQIAMDSLIYNTNAYYPTEVAKIVGEGYLMGENHIISVALYPLRINPVTGFGTKYSTISLTINYTLDNSLANNVLVCNDLSLRQQGWDETKAMVVNDNQVEGFAASGSPAHHLAPYLPDSLPSPESGFTCEYGGELFTPSSEYMIVTTRNLAHSFRRLAALKRQKGYTVAVRSIEGIVNDPIVQFGDKLMKKDGTYSCINDSAGKLRQYLRLAYMMEKTRYVLFGGRQVPFRYGCLPDNTTDPQTIMNLKTPTDLYFSDLTTNWNLDGDSYYGEPEELDFGRNLDASPELFVGRLTADYGNHIDNYTDKLLRYELNPGKGNASYLKRVLVTNGMKLNTFTGVATHLLNCYSLIYPETTLIPITANPTGASTINNINSVKYGIVNLFGHGYPYTINMNNTSAETASNVRSLHSMISNANEMGLDMLNNKYSPFIMYSESCTNMPYDIFQNYNKHWIFDNWNLGQSFTLGKNYGGVAYLGNTRAGTAQVRNGAPLYQTKLESLFIECLLNGRTKIGEAEAYSRQRYCFETMDKTYMPAFPHNLMGEPEFDIWTDEPTRFNGIDVTRNDSTIIVSNINSDNATVAICGNYTYPQRRKSTNGTATFNNVSPNSMVMVYQHNYFPYIAPLFVQNDTLIHSQYVIASDAYLGNNVDSNRTAGNVIIPSGVSYEMEFTGEVVLDSGIEVQHGASLTIVPSDY